MTILKSLSIIAILNTLVLTAQACDVVDLDPYGVAKPGAAKQFAQFATTNKIQLTQKN